MKLHFLLFVIAPFFCYSQNGHNGGLAEMPSTTDCPDWNDKKKPKGNADFYKMLRSRKKVAPKEEVSNVAPPIPISVSKTTGLPIYQPVSAPTTTNPGIEISPLGSEQTLTNENDIATLPSRDVVEGEATELSNLKEEGETAAKPDVKKNEVLKKKKKEKKKKAPRTKKTKKFKKGKSTSCPNF